MMMIDISGWKEFVIKDIFKCSTTKAVKTDEITDGNVAYITRSALNNGCSGFIEELPKKIETGNCITIGAEGLYAFYQDSIFLPGVKVYTLRHEKLNQNIGLFICTLLNASVFKYSYGRARILEKIMEETLPLPVDSEGNPNWIFMDEFIEKLQSRERESSSSIKNSIITKNNNHSFLNTNDWVEFSLSELFEISGSKTTPIEELKGYGIGKYPYITTKATNNGADGFFDYQSEKGNCLVIDSAVLGYCTYQELPFSASDHVEILRPKFVMNQYIAMFLVTLINQDTYRYSYGRKRSQKQIRRDVIKLPIDENGKPNWSLMEKYIKSLPYTDRI